MHSHSEAAGSGRRALRHTWGLVWDAGFIATTVVVLAAIAAGYWKGHSIGWGPWIVRGAALSGVGLAVGTGVLAITHAHKHRSGFAPVLWATGWTVLSLALYEAAIASGWVKPLSTSRWWGVFTLWGASAAVGLWWCTSVISVYHTARARRAVDPTAPLSAVLARVDGPVYACVRRGRALIVLAPLAVFALLAMASGISAARNGPTWVTYPHGPFDPVYGWPYEPRDPIYPLMILWDLVGLASAWVLLEGETKRSAGTLGMANVWLLQLRAGARAAGAFLAIGIVVGATSATQRLPEAFGGLLVAVWAGWYVLSILDLHSQLEVSDSTNPRLWTRALVLVSGIGVGLLLSAGQSMGIRTGYVIVFAALLPAFPLLLDSLHGAELSRQVFGSSARAARSRPEASDEAQDTDVPSIARPTMIQLTDPAPADPASVLVELRESARAVEAIVHVLHPLVHILTGALPRSAVHQALTDEEIRFLETFFDYRGDARRAANARRIAANRLGRVIIDTKRELRDETWSRNTRYLDQADEGLLSLVSLAELMCDDDAAGIWRDRFVTTLLRHPRPGVGRLSDWNDIREEDGLTLEEVREKGQSLTLPEVIRKLRNAKAELDTAACALLDEWIDDPVEFSKACEATR